MRRVPVLMLPALLFASVAVWAQIPRPSGVPTPPATVAGYVMTVELKGIAPELKKPDKVAPEADALMTQLRQQSQLVSRFYLNQDLSRQEIVSTDFVLPAGTVLLHKAGDKFYVIADPKAKTYLVMDSEALISALEGGAGILNSEYTADVKNKDGRKKINGYDCRQSTLTIGYVSSIPFENEHVLVRQTNEIDVWHTSALSSAAVMDHFFFKFQRDKTGVARRVISTEIGFPMEVQFVIKQAGGGKKAATVQPGSLHYSVTQFKEEPKLDSELFRIPPAGYRKVEKNPYFAAGALSSAAKAAAETVEEKK